MFSSFLLVFSYRFTILRHKHINVQTAWAERAKAAGYPERYAQVNLGHNSKAMTRAYSRKAEVEMPSLSEYERQQKAIIGNHETESVTQSVAA